MYDIKLITPLLKPLNLNHLLLNNNWNDLRSLKSSLTSVSFITISKMAALYLPCALCHFSLFISFYFLFFLFFLQCPHLYICIVCMYIWLNCIYLYLNVYCQCLMLTVCTKGLRVTQFQFSVCMYCTCGRIDNKARLDLTWLESHAYEESHYEKVKSKWEDVIFRRSGCASVDP